MSAGFVDPFRMSMGWWSKSTTTVTPIRSGCWAKGEVYHPAFKAGELYKNEFKAGELYKNAFNEGQKVC